MVTKLWLPAIVLFFLTGMHSPQVIACTKLEWLPAIRSISLISDADKIVLAETIRASQDNNYHVYEFIVKETIKGRPEDSVQVVLDGVWPGKSRSLGDHRDIGFWMAGEGGTGFSPNCTPRPGFGLARTYLLIFSDEPTSVSYEEIRYKDDIWLKFVREVVAEDSISPPLAVQEIAQQFQSASLFRCPTENDGRGVPPILMHSLRGAVPAGAQWPVDAGFVCGGEPREYLVVSMNRDAEGRKFFFPVIDGKADLSNYTEGLEIIPGNRLEVSKYFRRK
jgi:hypothetical protein